MAITNGLRVLSDLFAVDKVYEIPIYQRTYSWSKRELNDFMEDLQFQHENKNHFFGTILLRETAHKHLDFEIVEIVDGQQRLTTVILLIKEIINLLDKETDSTLNKKIDRWKDRYLCIDGAYRLLVTEHDRHFFQNFIIGDIGFPNTPLTPSQRRLKRAKEVFSNSIKELDTKSLLLLLKKLENLHVLIYTVHTHSEATVVFETTNDRGKSLTNLEKTKSFIMHKTDLCSSKPEPILSEINGTFSQIYNILDYLEENKIDALDEERVQRYHFILFENWNRKEDYHNYLPFIKKNCKELLLGKKNKELITYIKRYCVDLLKVFTATKEIIAATASNSNQVDKSLRDIFALKRVGNFYPVLIAAWIQYQQKKCSKKELLDLLKAIEVFSFRCYGIARKRSDTAETLIYGLGWDLFNDEDTVSNATDMIYEKIDEYVPTSVFKDDLSKENFRNSISGNDIKYLLLKYEEKIRLTKPKEPLKINMSDVFSQKIEIEHILPKNNNKSDSFNERYLHSLGNLALASKPANSSMSDKPFKTKVKDYYSKSVFRMQQELATVPGWNKTTITDRQSRVIQFALTQWKTL